MVDDDTVAAGIVVRHCCPLNRNHIVRNTVANPLDRPGCCSFDRDPFLHRQQIGNSKIRVRISIRRHVATRMIVGRFRRIHVGIALDETVNSRYASQGQIDPQTICCNRSCTEISCHKESQSRLGQDTREALMNVYAKPVLQSRYPLLQKAHEPAARGFDIIPHNPERHHVNGSPSLQHGWIRRAKSSSKPLFKDSCWDF